MAFALALGLGGCNLPQLTRPDAPSPQKPAAESKEVQRIALSTCPGLPKRKVLVTAFPLRYPEQIKPGEFIGWAEVTGGAVKQELTQGNRLLAVSAAHRFPFESADLAPTLEKTPQGKPAIVEWASQEQAQYVVAGLIRDFGMAHELGVIPMRQMKIEAFVYDAQGSLLANETFSRSLLLGGMPKSVAPGTREFAASRMGDTFNELIADLSRWVESQVTCQPFAVRVTRVEERRVHLDIGADRGITVGMPFQSWRPGTEPPNRSPYIPSSARSQPTVVVKSVSSAGSVAEIPQQRFPPTVRVGDTLYLAK